VDEGTRRLNDPEPGSRAALLEAEAEALRRRVDQLLDELDRRRTTTVSAVALLRRYALPALVTAAIVAGGVYAGLRWRESRQLSWYPREVRRRALRLSRLVS
jgi:hypothetical protein